MPGGLQPPQVQQPQLHEDTDPGFPPAQALLLIPTGAAAGTWGQDPAFVEYLGKKGSAMFCGS